ncbi:uncharacterized protein NMK_0599 [Novimethylophilus kurashikiensis]|uniref:Uncharacterized protein n=1 Tax=Novimethylophilus kurashikiensis TaxID=1825523 RepID=A0A2R5F8R8_9PROT|nr:uncharacterized protein NMK_0599 [Novimethylophilus kurashikiensis]
MFVSHLSSAFPGSDGLGIAPDRRLIHHPHHILAGNSEIGGQNLDVPAIDQSITDEIHRPDLVLTSRQFKGLPFDGNAMSLLAATDG